MTLYLVHPTDLVERGSRESTQLLGLFTFHYFERAAVCGGQHAGLPGSGDMPSALLRAQ